MIVIDQGFVIAPGEAIRPGDLVTVDRDTGKIRRFVVGQDENGFRVPADSYTDAGTGELCMPYRPAPLSPLRHENENEKVTLMNDVTERGDEPPELAEALDDLWDVAVPAYLRTKGKSLKALRICREALEAIMSVPEADGGMKQTRITQRRGPAIRFTGTLLAKTEFETRQGHAMRLEVYETAGGSYVAVSSTDLETRAEVVEPGEEIDMRCAVLEAFDWHERARGMVRDQLGWQLLREIP